uniref:Uncharacterized protein n=1 Tax=Cercocebus atys TaxID=9531 RepID=A0A2K5MGE0_CERAT
IGNKLSSPMGPCCGLSCDCCRLNVGPCNESETVEAVAAAAPASTTAEPARLNLGLAARPKRWTTKLLRRNKIWPVGNKGPVEELQEPAHGSVEDMKSELELSTAEYDDLSDEDLQEPAYGGVEDMKSELSTSKTQSQLYLVEDLSEGPSGGLEDLMTSEMAKERRQACLCWAEMAESRLKESPSSQVRGLLRLP